MCQVVERGTQWAPLGPVEVPGGGLDFGPPSTPCPSQAVAFPGQRGTVCGLALGQSSQPACLCQPPSPETRDKAGTRPDTPRSLFISPSFPSSLDTLFLLNHLRSLWPLFLSHFFLCHSIPSLFPVCFLSFPLLSFTSA